MDKNKLKQEITKKLKQEMSATGTGASFSPGGDFVASKYAFKKKVKEDAPQLAAGKVKDNYAVSHFGFKDAPSIPNRPSKAMDYKELWELNLKRSTLSSAEYQEAKKLKDFKAEDWKWDAKQDLYVKVMKEGNLEEVIIPDNIKKFAQRKGVSNIVSQVARWAEKAGKRVVGGTAIGKDYSTLILDLTYQGGEIRINTDTNDIEVKGEEVDNYNSFVRALKEEINEGYARFRNETKTRTKPEQFHSAVKEVKKKVNEINRLFEYMNRLQSELSESEGGLKYKKYTEKSIQQIKESTKQLFFKSTKLK
jgi:hypothetical protein